MVRRPDVMSPEVQRGLLAWADGRRSDLPWRQTRDPWAVLVSEVMLQQTQVERVRPKYDEFLTRFPDPLACAAAPQGAIVALWSGLGYNRRAVALHRCARVIESEHGGAVPTDLGSLFTLPGIGPYTARAILAFAFEADVGVVDTNVGRILARTTGRPIGRVEAQALADALVARGRGWAWNQAMLDLGAMVCTKRAPACDTCPLRDGCSWRGDGPDPAVGSAGVSGPQSTFAGSDREGRGRLVRALVAGPVAARDLAVVMGWPDDPSRADRVAAALVADALVVADGGVYRLA